VLDRPGLRSALGLVRSADILVRDHELCLVAPDRAGGWRLRAGGGVVVGPEPNLHPPRRLREHALDAFCHAFRPASGDTVLDIGAGIGREAITFSELVGSTGAVHCIEAHPVTFHFLRRVAGLNGLHNVHCHHLAISDAAGEVVIATEGDPRLYYRNRLVRGDAGLAVPAVTIAQFMATHQVEAIDLLAMNIEGTERAALAGIGPVADRIRNVAIACHDFRAEETGDESLRTKRHVKELLASHGFEIFERRDDARPWLGDFVYGARPS
jgi:FkbM family methyltransferase